MLAQVLGTSRLLLLLLLLYSAEKMGANAANPKLWTVRLPAHALLACEQHMPECKTLGAKAAQRQCQPLCILHLETDTYHVHDQ